MANEIQAALTLTYSNPAIPPAPGIGPVIFNFPPSFFNITGKNFIRDTMSVPTTAGGTAIPVSALANLGWAMFLNRDAANYVDIMTAVSGTAFIRIKPGMAVLFFFTPAIVAPAMLANTAPVVVEFMILEI